MAPTSLLLYCSGLLFTLHLISGSTLRSTYIVHMDNSEMPKEFSSHHNWYRYILNSLSGDTPTAADTGTPTLVYAYKTAIHGFSAVLSASELQSVSSSLGFISAYPDRRVQADTTHTYDFLSLNPVSGLWPASNYGEDIIIGLLDTGIWPEGRSFKDTGIKEIPTRWKGECEAGTSFNSSMCNRKLIGARYFNKGYVAMYSSINITMNSTRDTEGHGTFTSSTAGGNYVEGATYFGYASGKAAGIAPHARVAMYKVLWDSSGTTSDVIAGIDKAIEDGVDIISISLGFGRIPIYEDPMAIAAFAAAEKGIFVSVSAGNAGPSLSTTHTGVPWLLSVGASTVDRKFFGTVTLGDGSVIVGTSLFPENALISKVPLVYNTTIKNCDSSRLLSSQAKDQIVFCDNTRNIFQQMPKVCDFSEATGAIIISDDPFFLEAGEFHCPSVVINPNSEDLITLMNYINASTDPIVSITFQQTILGVSPAPAVADFSSRGPSGAFLNILKPDLIAPGSRIIAAWPPNLPAATLRSDLSLASDFYIGSGTSAAAPHAAGVAALLKGAHPDWSSAAIQSAMITTASVLDNTLNPIRDVGSNYHFATPLAMGAGHIDPNKALDPGLVYDAGASDYVSLLCATNYTKKQILTITRSSSYNCSNPSYDINHPSLMAFFNTSTSQSVTKLVQEFRRIVTNVGDGAATYKAKLAPMKGFSISVEPDTLVFQEKNEKQDFTLVIEGGLDGAGVVSNGALIWVDEGEKHSVRSPIVATNVS